MKVFISQPMNGLTNEQIKEKRRSILEAVKDKYNRNDIELIDSFFEDAPHDARPLWFLGKSLELLSTADIAVFGGDWKNARGCKIEHECASQYGIKIMEL